MILIGLTGGIGSGKSTVGQAFADRGAGRVDADAITRELQRPGEPVFVSMVERFGEGIVAVDGTLDRPAVAAIVFNDAQALKDLNAIVHPAVGIATLEKIASYSDNDFDGVVVFEIPLLVENNRTGFSGVLVVDVDPEIAVARLIAHRGFSEDDARARIANQATREERRAVADHVIDNSGSMDDLSLAIDEAWEWAQSQESVDGWAG